MKNNGAVRVLVILDEERVSSTRSGEAVDVLLTREAAERFIAEVRVTILKVASYLRIEEREL